MSFATQIQSAVEALRQTMESAKMNDTASPGLQQSVDNHIKHFENLIERMKSAEASKLDTVQVPGFGVKRESLEFILSKCMKPEEIDGRDPAKQHERVSEICRWFVRGGNPKWLYGHAMELVYYICTEGKDRKLDIHRLTQRAFMEGICTDDRTRDMLRNVLERLIENEEDAGEKGA